MRAASSPTACCCTASSRSTGSSFASGCEGNDADDQAVQSAVGPGVLRRVVLLRGWPRGPAQRGGGRGHSRHPPHHLRLPWARRLQDERGHGRHDLRADLPGVEAPRRHVQVLPPRHGARTRRRSRDERKGHRPGAPGSTGRPGGPGVRAAGPDQRSAVLALDAADRPDPERRPARRCQPRVALERLAGRGHRDARGWTRLRRAGPGDFARRPAAHLPVAARQRRAQRGGVACALRPGENRSDAGGPDLDARVGRGHRLGRARRHHRVLRRAGRKLGGLLAGARAGGVAPQRRRGGALLRLRPDARHQPSDSASGRQRLSGTNACVGEGHRRRVLATERGAGVAVRRAAPTAWTPASWHRATTA